MSDASIRQWEILASDNGRYWHPAMGDTGIRQWEILASGNGRSAPPSSPVTATVLDPSEITAKTTSKNPHNIHNGTEKICVENDYQVISISEVEVLQETQQEAKEKESKSQEQQNIFKEINIAVGAEYSFKK